MRHIIGTGRRMTPARALLIAMAACAAGGLAPSGAHARSLEVQQSFCTQANCADGEGPSRVVRDGAGNLYGTTGIGGAHGRGTVFKLRLNKNTGRYTREILHHFCSEQFEINCEDGAYPSGGLVRDKAGNLYGTTSQGGAQPCATGLALKGCGVVFALLYDADTRTYTMRRLLAFDGTGTGTRTMSGSTFPHNLIIDGDGNLYGASAGSGANDDYGSVFKLTPLNEARTRWSHKALYTFCRQSFCRDGRGVHAPVTMDRAGNLYGTTFEGGEHGSGVAFALIADGARYVFRRMHSFCAQANCADGENAGGLEIDRAGNLFGTTEWGGRPGGHGTVFKLKPNAARTAWTHQVLYKFCGQTNCGDGAAPRDLVIDTAGNVFGAAGSGGRAGTHGTLFQLTPNAAKTAFSFRVLYRFCGLADCADGSRPHALVMDPAGNLLVSTAFGGTGDDGGAVVELVND